MQLQLQPRYITQRCARLITLHDARTTIATATATTTTLQLTLRYTTLHYTTLHYTTLHDIKLHYATLITPHHDYNCNCTCNYTDYTTTQLHYNYGYNCNYNIYNYNCTTPHLSVHQWIRSAIPDSQQPTSPMSFLFLKLPPPPCAVLLVRARLPPFHSGIWIETCRFYCK